MEMTHDDWLALRRTGIGGSDVAGILGISPWSTPLDVYRKKTGEEPEAPDNPSMDWGRRLEPVIRQKYADVTGCTVTKPDETYRSQEHPFMLANLDGLTSSGKVLEIKTARTAGNWGDESDGAAGIPDYYLTQVQHYMTVMGAKQADVAVLIGASDFRIYTIDDDPELAQLLIEREAAFWKCVEERRPPAPVTLKDMVSVYPQSRAGKVEAAPSVFEALQQWYELDTKEKALKEQKALLQAQVTGAMGDSDTLTYGGRVVATWKSSKPRVTFDSAALKKAMPDIWNQYAKTGDPSRRFLVKDLTEF